jgi:TPR repeat protein
LASGSLPKPAAAPDKAATATAPTASPVPVVPTEPPPPAQPRSSSLETASLLERGDRLFGMGDVISARLFYERAAEAGDGQAALRLGETYDPTFLERAKLRAIKGDLKAAAFWYRRAKELGIVEADILLKGLQTK